MTAQSDPVSRLRDYFATQPDIILAYLFGSQARGHAGPLSDIDIAILMAPELDAAQRFDRQLQILADLTTILKTNEVDAVLLNEAPLTLSYRVLRDGILLLNRDEQQRILFTASTISFYLDFKPFIERHEQAILERAAKGELGHGYNPHHGALERYRQRRQPIARNKPESL